MREVFALLGVLTRNHSFEEDFNQIIFTKKDGEINMESAWQLAKNEAYNEGFSIGEAKGEAKGEARGEAKAAKKFAAERAALLAEIARLKSAGTVQ